MILTILQWVAGIIAVELLLVALFFVALTPRRRQGGN